MKNISIVKQAGAIISFLIAGILVIGQTGFADSVMDFQKLQQTKHCRYCDLSNDDFSSENLSNVDLTDADLSGAVWTDGTKCQDGSSGDCLE